MEPRVKEPAWHRRLRRQRSGQRLLCRVAAAATQLALHHGSQPPAILVPLVNAVQLQINSTTSQSNEVVLLHGRWEAIPDPVVFQVDGVSQSLLDGTALGILENITTTINTFSEHLGLLLRSEDRNALPSLLLLQTALDGLREECITARTTEDVTGLTQGLAQIVNRFADVRDSLSRSPR